MDVEVLFQNLEKEHFHIRQSNYSGVNGFSNSGFPKLISKGPMLCENCLGIYWNDTQFM
jgi:hypothetical protein